MSNDSVVDSVQQDRETKFNRTKNKVIHEDYAHIFESALAEEQREEEAVCEDVVAVDNRPEVVISTPDKERVRKGKTRKGRPRSDSKYVSPGETSADEKVSDRGPVKRSECKCVVGLMSPKPGHCDWHVMFRLSDARMFNESVAEFRANRQTLHMQKTTRIPMTEDMYTCALLHLIRREGVHAMKWLVRMARLSYTQRREVWSMICDVIILRSCIDALTCVALCCVVTLYDEHERLFVMSQNDAYTQEDRLRHAHAADLTIAKAVAIVCELEDDPHPLWTMLQPLTRVVPRALASAIETAGPVEDEHAHMMPWLRDVTARCLHGQGQDSGAVVEGEEQRLLAQLLRTKQITEALATSTRKTVVTSVIRASELPMHTVFENEAAQGIDWYMREDDAVSKAERAAMLAAQRNHEKVDEARQRRLVKTSSVACSAQCPDGGAAAAYVVVDGKALKQGSRRQRLDRVRCSEDPCDEDVEGADRAAEKSGTGASLKAGHACVDHMPSPAYTMSGVARLVHTQSELTCSSIQSIVSALGMCTQIIQATEFAVQSRWNTVAATVAQGGVAPSSSAPPSVTAADRAWMNELVDDQGAITRHVHKVFSFTMALLHASCDAMRCRGVELRASEDVKPFADPVRHMTDVFTHDVASVEQYVCSQLRRLDVGVANPAHHMSEVTTLQTTQQVLSALMAAVTIKTGTDQHMWSTHPKSASWVLLLEASRHHFVTLTLTSACIALASRRLVRNHAYAMAMCLTALQTKTVMGGHSSAWINVSARKRQLIGVMSSIAQSDADAFLLLGDRAREVCGAVPPQISHRGDPARPQQCMRSFVTHNPKVMSQCVFASVPLQYVSELRDYGGDPMLCQRGVSCVLDGAHETGSVCSFGKGSTSASVDFGSSAVDEAEIDERKRFVEICGRRLVLSCAFMASQTRGLEARIVCMHHASLRNAVAAYQATAFTSTELYATPMHGAKHMTLTPQELEDYEKVSSGRDERSVEARLKTYALRDRTQRKRVFEMGQVWESHEALMEYKHAQEQGPEFPFDLSPEEVRKNERSEQLRKQREKVEKAREDKGLPAVAGDVVLVDQRNYKPDMRNAKLSGPLFVPSSRLFNVKELEKRGHKFKSEPLLKSHGEDALVTPPKSHAAPRAHAVKKSKSRAKTPPCKIVAYLQARSGAQDANASTRSGVREKASS